MDIPRMSRSVRRITVLRKDASGALAPVTIFQRRGSKKKGTDALELFEKGTRRLADAQARAASSYGARHKKSNRKRKDGWVRDLNVNLLSAGRKGTKALKLNRLFLF